MTLKAFELTTRNLEPSDEVAFLEAAKDWEGEEPHWFSFCWTPGMPYVEMLEILRKERAGIDLAPGRVPHSMLYGFVDGKIVGRVSVRHTLNEKLAFRGGHMGYAVAPRYRKRGYARAMVEQALAYCRGLGLDKIMVTCADENEASWRVMERLGGELQDKVWDEEELIRRYWLTL